MQHAANLDKSETLKAIYKILSDCEWHTTKEIAEQTGSVVVSTRISELRSNDIKIACRYVGKSNKGNKIYQYKILKGGEDGK